MSRHPLQAALDLLCRAVFVPLCASTALFGSAAEGSLAFDGVSADAIPDPRPGPFVSLGPPYSLRLNDPTGRALTNDARPLTPPDLQQFEPDTAPESGTVGFCVSPFMLAAFIGRIKGSPR